MSVLNVIGGERVTGDGWTPILDPFTGAVVEQVASATDVQVEEAIARATASAAEVARLTVYERAQILRGVADRIAERADPIAHILVREAGKPIDLAQGEVARASETFRFAADELRGQRGESLELDAAANGAGKWGVIRRFPVGPIAAITPFNFPLNLVAHKLAPALATGCPVVLKPADKTPLAALVLAELILEAGWPPRALSVLNTTIERATPLIEDERLRLLSFTGSAPVGWSLKARAGRKKVLLELGGDAAVIVTDSVGDWDSMVRRIAFGAFAFGGQVCVSVQRIFVHRAHYERFVGDLVKAVERDIHVGPPHEAGVVMSALIDDHAVAKTNAFVEDALGRGAKRLTGGHREGRLFDPMVMVDVAEDALLACDEVFGPVVCVWPYDSLEDALERVNASPYGLQAGVYSRDLHTVNRAYETLEVGAVLIDEIPTWRVDQMPYGGVKASGFGREGLRDTLAEYTEPRLLVLPRA